METSCALIQIGNRTDGVLSQDGQIMATYLHGVFDHPEACAHLLNWVGLKTTIDYDYRALLEQGYWRTPLRRTWI